MPYNPALPADGSLIVAAELRSQFAGLHDEIAAIPQGPEGPEGPQGPAFATVVVDGVDTLPPGNMASVTASITGNIVHLFFNIPAGIQGLQGEVTQAQLSNDLVNNANATFNTIMPLTSNNSNGVAELVLSASNPPTQAEVNQVIAKLNELILALRR